MTIDVIVTKTSKTYDEKNRFKFKFKTHNKGTNERAQMLKLKTWSVQDQNINRLLLQWNKKT